MSKCIRVIFLSSVFLNFIKLRDFQDTPRLFDNAVNAYRSIR